MTKIQWTNKTWNPIIGCSKISPGCQNCYAEKMANRLLYMFEANCGEDGQSTWAEYSDVTAGGRWNGKTAFVSNALGKTLKRKKPTMYFVCSMGDIFHESVPFEWVDRVMAIISRCPQHTFQILTKRPERMKEYFLNNNDHYGRMDEIKQALRNMKSPTLSAAVWPLPNLWLGVTAENQEQADKRIPILLDIPAAVRFVSVEPMLERIDIYQYLGGKRDIKPPHKYNGGIDWVIVGCESGHQRRTFIDSWVSCLITECRNAGVPIFVKQLALRRDKAGRDVTGLPGLWDESDRLVVSKNPEEWPEHLRARQFPEGGEK